MIGSDTTEGGASEVGCHGSPLQPKTNIERSTERPSLPRMDLSLRH
jgi:hypothetical protein